MDKLLENVRPVNKTMCRVLGENYNAAVAQKLEQLKQKFILRMQRAGKPDPEGDWVRAEPTYRNMLMNDPQISQQVQQDAPQGTPGGGGTGSSEIGQQIYSIADQIRSSVNPELQDHIHRIMELAMQLTQTNANAAAA